MKLTYSYRLLIVDEIGYFPVEPAVANVFFQIVAGGTRRSR